MNRSAVLRCMLPLFALATPALADPLAASSCAKTLSPAAMEIYAAAAPDMRPGTDMVSLLRAKVIPMVMNGDMNRTTARTAATAASFCLRRLQQHPETIADRTLSSTPVATGLHGYSQSAD